MAMTTIPRIPDYDATTLLTEERLAALLGIPLRYMDGRNYKPNPSQPGFDSTAFTIPNLEKAITFDGQTISFLDTTIEGLVAINVLIHQLRIKTNVERQAAKDLANVIHTIATEAYDGFDEKVEAYCESLSEEEDEEED
jgi:hypothetical protein